jgi:hypothetical protein
VAPTASVESTSTMWTMLLHVSADHSNATVVEASGDLTVPDRAVPELLWRQLRRPDQQQDQRGLHLRRPGMHREDGGGPHRSSRSPSPRSPSSRWSDSPPPSVASLSASPRQSTTSRSLRPRRRAVDACRTAGGSVSPCARYGVGDGSDQFASVVTSSFSSPRWFAGSKRRRLSVTRFRDYELVKAVASNMTLQINSLTNPDLTLVSMATAARHQFR